MPKMIVITEITSDNESKDISINSDLIFKIETINKDDDSYGNSIIYFQNNQPEVHTSKTIKELNNIINNG